MKTQKKNRKSRHTVGRIICGILFSVAAILFYVVKWFEETYGFTFEQLFYTMTSPLEGAGNSVVIFVVRSILPPILLIILVYVVVSHFLCIERFHAVFHIPIGSRQIRLDLYRILRRAGALLCVAALALSVLYTDSVLDISGFITLRMQDTAIYEEYYVDPETVSITAGTQTKNLIYIYMESMETTYMSVSDGGEQEVNYIPNLTQLAYDNLTFSDGDALGGFTSLTGTTWTIAALLATSTGLPFSFPVDGNSMNEYDTFASGMTSIGDILADFGYTQEFLCGSDGDFAGRASFFEQHGDYTVFDYYAAIDAGYIASDYYVWWGFEDAILYEIAKDELTALAESDEPFNFTMLTVDTHHYDGYVCSLCGDEYDTQLANVLQCADNQIAAFVSWITEQDFYEDTVIVISGDHPRMDTDLVDGVAYAERTIYNCIIGTDTEVLGETNNRDFTTFDMFPTVLSALGYEIEGNRLGLGTDLFSGEQTLLEQLGYDYLNTELGKESSYYVNHFK